MRSRNLSAVSAATHGPALTSYLRQRGVRTKIRTRRNEKTGRGSYSRGALYQLLRNHLYVGEIEHKGSVYQGQHEAILDRELWEQVQQLLDENRRGTRTRPRGSGGSILTGLLFGESGVRYIPTALTRAVGAITKPHPSCLKRELAFRLQRNSRPDAKLVTLVAFSGSPKNREFPPDAGEF